MMDWLIVLAGTIVFDILYALFNRALMRDAKLQACILSGTTNLASAVCIMEYAHTPWLITASAVGGGIGTLIAMKIDGVSHGTEA